MTLNAENNSARESVNTRPKWKAYFVFMRSFFASHQQNIALAAGYILVALLFFNLGTFTQRQTAPDVKIEEPSIDLTEVYDKLKAEPTQFIEENQSAKVAGETFDPNCQGKIKGNVSSSGKIYHLPTGSFYKRTVAEICFDSEGDAIKAGFRKSTR